METMIDRVVAAAGSYVGTGHGAESGPFAARVDIDGLLGGMGATIVYVATAPDGTELHAEHTVLAYDSWSGEATLHVLCAELSGVARLVQTTDSTFNNGGGFEGFELQIEIRVAAELEYIWSWGAPGEELAERSRAILTKT